jgi:hypothetical protein
MIHLVIMVLFSMMALADCDQPKPWWETAFPGSVETRSTKQATDDVDEEYGAREESAEPEIYHWDNIYLEPSYPEVIVDPYGSQSQEDEEEDW